MISFYTANLGGTVDGERKTGREPMPWLLFLVKYHFATWDRHGNRAAIARKARVIVQAKDNVRLIQSQLFNGREVVVIGHVVGGNEVAADGDVRGDVLFADAIQFPNREETPCP